MGLSTWVPEHAGDGDSPVSSSKSIILGLKVGGKESKSPWRRVQYALYVCYSCTVKYAPVIFVTTIPPLTRTCKDGGHTRACFQEFICHDVSPASLRGLFWWDEPEVLLVLLSEASGRPSQASSLHSDVVRSPSQLPFLTKQSWGKEYPWVN